MVRAQGWFTKAIIAAKEKPVNAESITEFVRNGHLKLYKPEKLPSSQAGVSKNMRDVTVTVDGKTHKVLGKVVTGDVHKSDTWNEVMKVP